MNVIGYIRVSTREQGLSIEAQRKRLNLEAELRGWSMRVIVDEGQSGAKAPSERPGLREALGLLKSGAAHGIVVTKLDRIARSLADVSHMLAQSNEEKWNLIALDLGIDTSTPEGQLIAGIMASIAQWERARIRERIIEALAITRENGTRLGAPHRYNDDIAREVKHHRDAGLKWGEVAEVMSERGVRTKAGNALDVPQLRSLYARAGRLAS